MKIVRKFINFVVIGGLCNVHHCFRGDGRLWVGLNNCQSNTLTINLVYLDAEPFIPLLLASYWCLVLKLQLGSVTHFLLLAPPPGKDSPWKSVSCLKIMKVRFAGCLSLICIAVAGLGAPLSRFLEGAPYKFLNE